MVWSTYVLDYINIPGVTKITQSVGVGETSTVSTPLPSQAAVDNDGGGQCGIGDGLSKKGLREACDRAINKYEDDTVYSDYVSRYSRERVPRRMTVLLSADIYAFPTHVLSLWTTALTAKLEARRYVKVFNTESFYGSYVLDLCLIKKALFE